ncbi:hypothetical protein NEOLEDRAFT_1246483 [Neolentinus lepideus HHB14362 ss-1]|uniref:Uncharacterized protein n=1 Tax=Neolentinus lepideus HHB14362 ss-1 TaxID=1314782 RepID=A0A165MHH8_9AGAM|nr:hypothetical protein NEOLEDRAFT_1246483 [Neolentinus lepideus HHB14362 ss-1]
MAERGYQNLNASVLKQISKALEHDSATDIEPVLRKVYTSYAKYPHRIGECQAKRQTDAEEHSLPLKRHRHPYPDALLPFASCIQPHLPLTEPHLLEQWPLSCSFPHSIIFPLSPVVRNLLKIADGYEPDLSSILLRSVLSSTPIWEDSSRAVVQTGEDVVKVAQHLDHDEHSVLQLVEKNLPSVPAPRALGLVTVGTTSFMFLTKIPGTTLETRWSSLSTEAKTNIRRVLDKYVHALRELDPPHGSPFGSPVGRRFCKDIRRDERVSPSSIYSESQFNDCLLDPPTSRAALNHKK